MAESKPAQSKPERSRPERSAGESGGDRLPFEPTNKGRKKKQEARVTQPAPPEQKRSQPPKRSKPSNSSSKTPSTPPSKALEETRIPDAVGKRMLRRMALFSGVPSALGISTFFICYYLLTHKILDFPNAVVFAVSMLFFGLGVVGLSYGVLSASWEEDIEGSLLGTQEFALNFGRLRRAWREAREAKAGP